MKRILILASSPRRGGNSDLLAEQFAKGAETAGHSVETLYLRDLRIFFCRGCQACRTMGYCVIRDSVSKILNKLMFADVICFASPVYFYSVNGAMKTFLDRCLPLYGRMKNKDFYYMVTAEDDNPTNLARAFEAFDGFADCFNDVRCMGRIYGAGADKKGDIQKTYAYTEAFEMGKNV